MFKVELLNTWENDKIKFITKTKVRKSFSYVKEEVYVIESFWFENLWKTLFVCGKLIS